MRPHRSTAASTIRLRPVVGGEVDGERRDPIRIADRLLQFGQPVRVAARAKHRHARLGELCRATETDAAAGPRDDCHLHVSPPHFVSAARI